MQNQYGRKREALLKALKEYNQPVRSKDIQYKVIELLEGKKIHVHEIGMILSDLAVAGEVIKHPRDRRINAYRWSINKGIMGGLLKC